MVLGLLDQLQTVDLLTVLSDRLTSAFNRSGTTQTVAINISSTFDRVWHDGLLHRLRSYGISGQIFDLIFSNRWLEVVLDGSSLQKNIQSMLESHKASCLVLHFSYYTLMTFLMILSVILLSMLMILISILSVIRHLIYGNNLNWLLNLNLIYEILWTGTRSGLLIGMLGKLGKEGHFCSSVVDVLSCFGCIITCINVHFLTDELDNAIQFSTLTKMSGFLWLSSKWAHHFCCVLQYTSWTEV